MVKYVLGRGYQAEFGVFLGGVWEDSGRFKVETELIRTSDRFTGHFAFYAAYRSDTKSGLFDDSDGVSRKLLVFLEKLKLSNLGIFVVHYKLKSEFSASEVIEASLHAAAAALEQRRPPPVLDLGRLPPEPRPMFRSPLIDLNSYEQISDFSSWSDNERLLVDLAEDWIARLRSFVAPQISVLKILQVAVFLVDRKLPNNWAEVREFLKKNSDSLHVKLMTTKQISNQNHSDVLRAKRLLQGLSLHAVRRTSEIAGILLQWTRNRLGACMSQDAGNTSTLKHAIFSAQGVQTLGTHIRVRPPLEALTQVKRKLQSPSPPLESSDEPEDHMMNEKNIA